MRGLCGVALADPRATVDPVVIARMRESIHHRGPDDAGAYVRGRVGLGHQRLSITDLGHGHQPMANEDETLWIAYNGEVFNHAALRPWHLARGHTLRTHRVPFLDHHLIEWAAQLPPHVKLDGGTGKALVKRAAERMLPRSITHAPKRGFSLPLAKWLRYDARDIMDTYLPRSDDELLSASYVRRLVHEHASGIDHTARLWRVLAFQVWRRDILPAEAARSFAVAI